MVLRRRAPIREDMEFLMVTCICGACCCWMFVVTRKFGQVRKAEMFLGFRELDEISSTDRFIHLDSSHFCIL